MSSRVYLQRIKDWKDFAGVVVSFRNLLEKSKILDMVRADRPAAIKLTFGEAGNQGHPPVSLVRELVVALRARGGHPFLTETNTLYNGRRKNALDHLEVAREHGFAFENVGAPILFGDGLLGRETFDVTLPSDDVPVAHLVPTVRDTDSLVGLAHATGHLLTGFGGAIKNIGMGLASRVGKLEMHSVVSPLVREEQCILCLACIGACAHEAIRRGETAVAIDGQRCTGCAECLAVCPTGAIGIDWSKDSRRVQERMAEYALAVCRVLEPRIAFVNLLNHISDHCDCIGPTPNLIAPDIGIALSRDPVALDQATLDLVREAAGGDPFRAAWPEADAEAQLAHAEAIALGSRHYELVETG